MRMQMEYQFIIAYFCERPHSKIKIRPSRLQTLFNLLKILLSVTRITITTGHAYFFSHYCPPQPWEFLVVTQFLCRWTRSTAATLEPYPGIRGSGDSGMPYTYVYVIWGSHNTLSSALLLMPFHMVLNEWHIKFFLFSAAFCFCDIFMNASKCSPSFFLHFYHPPPPSTFFFFCFFFCILCGSALGLFMRNATHSFLPVQLRPLFVCYCFANSSGQNAHTHTHTHSRTHGDMAGKPFSTQICSISNGSTTISVFFSPRFSVAFFLTASC